MMIGQGCISGVEETGRNLEGKGVEHMLSRRRGFTLIELLVVIAIIAILAAILFPVFISVKDAGKRAACMSHGKQLGAALLAYIGDWDDTFPVQPFIDNYYGPGPIAGPDHRPDGPEDLCPYDLRVLLKPYTRNKRMWDCPSAYGYWGNRYTSVGQGLLTWMYLCEKEGGRYFQWDTNGLEKKRLSSISRPSRKCSMFDWFTALSAPWTDYIPHNGGTILVYCDGHSQYHKIKKFAGILYPVGYSYKYRD